MIRVAIEAAREAGKLLRQHLGNVRRIETKMDQEFNLVTEVDRASEAKIVEIIRRHFPKHGILAEEGGASGKGAETVWIIDPLDGTTNFAHGLPIFSVSIAIEREGSVIAGVVYDPMRDELFHAEKGVGAFLNNRPIRVSASRELASSLLVTGFPYTVRENPQYCMERFLAFLYRARAVRRLGSAALDCAYVAAGRLDGFWEVALQPWDVAAGALLITEAGGRVSGFEGEAHSIYDLPFLGSNGMIHDQMIEVLRRAPSLRILTDGYAHDS